MEWENLGEHDFKSSKLSTNYLTL